MSFGLKDRIGNTSSVGQFSSFGGTSSFNAVAPDPADNPYTLSTTGHGTSDPVQIITPTGATVNIVFPPANQSLGMTFMVVCTNGNNIQPQDAGGNDLTGAYNNATQVFRCLNRGDNAGGQWYRIG